MKTTWKNIMINVLRLTMALLLVLAWTTPANLYAQEYEVDSVFVKQSRPIIFVVNRTEISRDDERWITDSLKPALEKLGERGIIIGRAAASPEGPTPNNQRLANGRRAAADRVLASLGIDVSRVNYDVVTEDYPLLRIMMRMNDDPDYVFVDSLMQRYVLDPTLLKRKMMTARDGQLWKRLLKEYYPRLRAVRIMPIDRGLFFNGHILPDLKPLPFPEKEMPEPEVLGGYDLEPQPLEGYGYGPLLPQHRIPKLNVRTNLLYDLFYMPHFGFAPMWNIGVEYYPRKGHFTYSLWFMEPYYHRWGRNKFFQIRDYEFETRFYFRGTKRADYRGFYVSAALDFNVFGVGLGKRKGWEGEGAGAQATLGYVQPLCRHHQWKLQFVVGAGFYMSQYDPYLYGIPDYFGHREDGLYYYNTNLYRHEFKKRQHRYTWFGPTQLAITLSYDLLWRKGTDQSKADGGGKTRGLSFRRWEVKPSKVEKRNAR